MDSKRKYEGLFIFPPEEGPEAAKTEEKRLEETLSRFGGHVLDRKDWGRRPLGYAIRRFREGRFVLWNFEMEPARVDEFRKSLHLENLLLKTTIVKYREPKPEKPPKEKRSHRPYARKP